MDDLHVWGSFLIGLNAAAALSAAVTLVFYGRVAWNAAWQRPIPDRAWTAWLIVMGSAGCLAFFGNFAYQFHVRNADPINSSIAWFPVRLFYLICELTAGACAVAAAMKDRLSGRKVFFLWSMSVAIIVALVTAYEADRP